MFAGCGHVSGLLMGTVRQNELETGQGGFVASPYDKTLPIQVL